MMSLNQVKLLSKKIPHIYGIGIFICAVLIPPLLSSESSYASSRIVNKSNYMRQANQYAQNRGNYNDFLSALARRETGAGNPTYSNTNNQWGFIGKYQFGEGILIDLGYYKANSYYGQPGVDQNYWRGTWTGQDGVKSKEDFLKNKNNVQEKAIQESMQLRWSRIQAELNGRSINEFIGKQIRGIVITKSGLLAAAHLRGEKNVAKLLLKNQTSQDELGTSILDYLKEFAGYQVPF